MPPILGLYKLCHILNGVDLFLKFKPILHNAVLTLLDCCEEEVDNVEKNGCLTCCRRDRMRWSKRKEGRKGGRREKIDG